MSMSTSDSQATDGQNNLVSDKHGKTDRPERQESPKHEIPDEMTDDDMVPLPTPEEISIVREAMFIFLVCLTQLLTQSTLSQTVLTNGDIAKTFGVEENPGEQSWFAASFSLSVGTFILVSGRLGDIYGYKKLYIIAYGIISISSVIAGVSAYSHSKVFFDVMRGFQGLGFSLAFPNSVALIGHYYPVGIKKIIFMCLYGAVAPGGFIIGSLFNTLICSRIWWPWQFYILAIVTFGISILGYFIIPKNIGSHHKTGSDKEDGRQTPDADSLSFDWWGSVTGVSGLILINFSFNEGPNVGWSKPYVYVLLIIGFLLIAAFLVVERKVKNPLVPKEVLRGETGFVLGCIAAGWSSFGIWLFYMARFNLELDQRGTILTAVTFIPPLICGFIASGVTALIIQRVPVSLIMTISMVAFLVANILVGTRPVNQIYWAQNFVSHLIAPFGMDMSFPSATIILSHSFPKSQQGLAASLVATFVNYSISIGLGFAGTVEYYTTKDKPHNMETLELGIRNASRMGMGFAGLGVVLAVCFVGYDVMKKRRNEKSL